MCGVLESAEWIGTTQDVTEGAAPVLRRTFTLAGKIQSARLRICGLGYYEASINSQCVGDQVLDPAQTDYEKRAFYVTHDVTDLLSTGKNALGVMLGNGWYNQNRVWGPTGFSYGQPRLLAALEVLYEDGATALVATDASWRWHRGPITENNIYAGEHYDARLELPGWHTAEFDDSAWESVQILPALEGQLEEQPCPPIRRIEELCPRSIQKRGASHVLDMGQNFSGWIRLQVEAPAGTEISLRFAETLDHNGDIDTASTGTFATQVEQIDRYICKGGGVETWAPRFTYHGFRYVEVTGWPGDPDASNLTGVVVHTDLPQAGGFECSDERLNTLHRMALWTHRNNMHGIPEDCPVRERCGWLGDANVVAEFSMFNFHARTFWRKYLDDIETTRALNGGLPCMIAPGKRLCGTATPDWAATFILVPWYVYLYYGDEEVLPRHWDGMRLLMEHFGAQAEDWVLPGGLGDWYDPGGESPCSNTDPAITTTLWFLRCARVMARTARLLNQPEDAERYDTWVANIAAAFVARFYDEASGSFGTQTANAMALKSDVVPAGLHGRVVDSLVADIKQRDTHLNCGIMGVRFLFEALTENGHGDLALAIMHQDTYPGFGDLIARGATTLWEWWGEEAFNEINGPRSLCHPMMGGYDNWFFNTLAGIQPDPEAPGFRHFHLRPHFIAGLDWLRAHHDSPRGRIMSEWSRGDGNIHWKIQIPEGVSASAVVPGSSEELALCQGPHELTFVDPS